MTSLSEFLLSRIAEDEAAAKAAPAECGWYVDEGGVWVLHDPDGASASGLTRRFPIWADGAADHIARHDPARVLAECEAKRRLVEMQAANDEDRYLPGFHYKAQMIERFLRVLALPYADHPDYRQEWKP